MSEGYKSFECELNADVQTYRIRLIFPIVEVVAVVEDVFIGRIEAGFHTVLHNLAGSGRTL